MKCILTIGYTKILLPDHKGVEKIIDMLSKGIVCEKDYCSDYRKPVFLLKEEVDLGFEILPSTAQFKASEEFEEKMKEKAPGKKSTKQLPHLKLIGA